MLRVSLLTGPKIGRMMGVDASEPAESFSIRQREGLPTPPT
jgi:hypothetical protein